MGVKYKKNVLLGIMNIHINMIGGQKHDFSVHIFTFHAVHRRKKNILVPHANPHPTTMGSVVRNMIFHYTSVHFMQFLAKSFGKNYFCT